MTAVRVLLDRAVGYALAAVADVPDGAASWPTPCAEWNLGELLDHLDESVVVVSDVLGARRDRRTVAVGGCPVSADLVTATAALELVVHGWDVRRAVGRGAAIPPDLATALLAVAGLVVPVTNRRPQFADPVEPAPSAGPGDRLVAYLGRVP
ncbi:MAG TPA: hypothetical protein VFB74_04240 [Kribbellaceae bacterium]|nr:hypothetical protein [Kribbellaceae bacterium]